MSKDFKLEFKDKQPINCTIYYPSAEVIDKTIIFVHGFKGFKDWGFGPYLSNYFLKEGFCVITFNFSLNGIGDDKLNFTETENFAKNTISREVEEIEFIIDKVKENYFGDFSKSKLGLLGHSRGGADSIIASSSNNKIDALCTWAAISKYDRFSERQKEDWKNKGYLEIINSRTNQIMKMNYSHLEDIISNIEGNLKIERALSELDKQLLICHGEQDLAVPVKEAQQLFEWSNKEKTELFIIPKAGHTFDIKHPFEGSNEKFEKLLSKTSEFFTKFLN